MVNKQYRAGRDKEYRIMKKKLAEGFDIIARTAGSHSSFDIIAVKKNPPTIEFIQSKKGYFSANKKEEIEKDLDWLNNKFLCSFRVDAETKPMAKVRKVHSPRLSEETERKSIII